MGIGFRYFAGCSGLMELHGFFGADLMCTERAEHVQ